MTSPHLMPEGWTARHGRDFWTEFDTGGFEPHTKKVIEEYVSPDSTYLDIGAWIGPTVLWAAPFAGRVVAVEPDPVAYGLLTKNTRMFANVERVQAAIAPQTGEIGICPREGMGFGSSMSRVFFDGIPSMWAPNEQVTVPAFTILDFFTAYELENVSLVKMDIEGGEAEILQTVCPYLAEQRIPFLCSIHPGWGSQEVQTDWFKCFGDVQKVPGGAPEVLALP